MFGNKLSIYTVLYSLSSIFIFGKVRIIFLSFQKVIENYNKTYNNKVLSDFINTFSLFSTSISFSTIILLTNCFCA